MPVWRRMSGISRNVYNFKSGDNFYNLLVYFCVVYFEGRTSGIGLYGGLRNLVVPRREVRSGQFIRELLFSLILL